MSRKNIYVIRQHMHVGDWDLLGEAFTSEHSACRRVLGLTAEFVFEALQSEDLGDRIRDGLKYEFLNLTKQNPGTPPFSEMPPMDKGDFVARAMGDESFAKYVLDYANGYMESGGLYDYVEVSLIVDDQ